MQKGIGDHLRIGPVLVEAEPPSNCYVEKADASVRRVHRPKQVEVRRHPELFLRVGQLTGEELSAEPRVYIGIEEFDGTEASNQCHISPPPARDRL